jgi:hypothetical protein
VDEGRVDNSRYDFPDDDNGDVRPVCTCFAGVAVPRRPLLVLHLLGCLLIATWATVRAESAELAARVRTADEDTAAETPRDSRPPIDPCVTPADLGYKAKRLGELSLNIRLNEDLMPADCSANVFRRAGAANGRQWAEAEFHWAATDLFHQPAYFDDPILERYGQSQGRVIQPILSGAHFFGQFPLIPYKIGIDRTHDHIYTLGYYRPGSPMPLLGRRLPLEMDAAALESMSWVALFLIFP